MRNVLWILGNATTSDAAVPDDSLGLSRVYAWLSDEAPSSNYIYSEI